MTRADRLLELYRLVQTWRAAECTTQSLMFVVTYGVRHRIPSALAASCVGENHHAGCVVELALQDVKAAAGALELEGL